MSLRERACLDYILDAKKNWKLCVKYLALITLILNFVT